MVNTTSKSWGWSTRVYYDPGLQVEKVFIRAGGYSSIHSHESKANQFIVHTGLLQINYFGNENNIIACEAVTSGNQLVVPATVRHQFMARSDVHGFEVYWTKDSTVVDPDDIVRYSTNGVDGRCSGRPFESKHAWCCECNKVYNLHEMVTVCVDSAIRDMCRECLERTGTKRVDVSDGN